MKKFFLAVSILLGTMVGAGIFSLPYVALKSGFLTVLFYLLVLGIVAIINHLFLADISLKTKDFIRLPSFAGIYLGKKAEKLTLAFYIFSFYGVLLVYLILGGKFLSFLFGWPLIFSVLIYFFLGSILIYFGIKAVDRIEFYSLIIFFGVLLAIFVFKFPLIKIGNLFLSGKPNFFLPYGPVLFSLWGATLIPEVEEFLRGRKNLLKKSVVFSILLAILIYTFFIILVLGICGIKTSSSTLSSLSSSLGGNWGYLLFSLGVISTFTSFITLGLTSKKIFLYDLKMKKSISFFLTILPPLILYFLGLNNFLGVLSFLGAVFIGGEGILINLIYQKVYPRRKILTYSLILVFILGIIYEIVRII